MNESGKKGEEKERRMERKNGIRSGTEGEGEDGKAEGQPKREMEWKGGKTSGRRRVGRGLEGDDEGER